MFTDIHDTAQEFGRTVVTFSIHVENDAKPIAEFSYLDIAEQMKIAADTLYTFLMELAQENVSLSITCDPENMDHAAYEKLQELFPSHAEKETH